MRKFRLNFRKVYIFLFPKNVFAFKPSVWTHRMQFLQPRLKLFNLMPKKRRSKTEKDRKLIIFPRKIEKRSSRHVESSFGNATKVFATIGRKFLHNVRNWWKNSIFFLKNVSVTKILRWTPRLQLLQPFRFDIDKRKIFFRLLIWKAKIFSQ